jgi:hypothetical protein
VHKLEFSKNQQKEPWFLEINRTYQVDENQSSPMIPPNPGYVLCSDTILTPLPSHANGYFDMMSILTD